MQTFLLGFAGCFTGTAAGVLVSAWVLARKLPVDLSVLRASVYGSEGCAVVDLFEGSVFLGTVGVDAGRVRWVSAGNREIEIFRFRK